jgi:hypothetical protein
MSFDIDDIIEKDDALIAALDDMSPAMAEMEAAIAAGIERNFDTESAAGESWTPLAASTQRDRARKGYGAAHQILVRTGQLKADATKHRKHNGHSVEVGFESGHEIAGIHMGDGTRSKIPLRDAISQGEETHEGTDAALISHLEKNHG